MSDIPATDRRPWRATTETPQQQASLTADMLALRPGAIWQAFRAESAACIAVCIYLFLEYVKPEQAYPIFGILPFLRIALIITIVMFVADREAKLRGGWLAALIVLFLLHCILSSFFAYRPDYSWEKFSIVGLWVLIFFLITGIISTERRMFLFFVVFVLANFKMSQFGFFTWAKRGFGFASYGLTGAGWFHNSGELGLQMAMFFAFMVCLARTLRAQWTKWARRLVYFMILSSAACVVGSNSRGAVVAAAAVILYLAVISSRKFQALFASAAFVGLAYLVMPTQTLERFRTAGEDATSLSREFYWEKAREMMHDHPFLGVGYYNWGLYFRDHYFDPTRYWRVEEAHNTYLQLGAELGYTGLVIFCLLVIVSFFINWRTAKLCKQQGFDFLYALSVGMNAAGLGLVVGSMFLTAFFLPNYWIHFAMTISLQLAARRKMRDTTKPGST